jgi:hypothetical protein
MIHRAAAKKEVTRPKRKYQTLWEEIKLKGVCVIRPANTTPQLFKCIKKAVIKEKDLDLAYKFEMDDRRTKLEIERSDSGIITFRLKKGIGLEDV